MMEASNANKNIVAFLQLLARFRDEDASIYNAMAPGYDRFARPWDEGFAQPALDYLLEQSAKRVDKQGRVLDAGCGTGLRIPQLIQHFEPSELVALDISEAMLDMARRKHDIRPVSFYRGNLYSLPFEDNSFDAVLATWAIETLRNPGRAVQEFLRVIKPDGVVAYSFVQLPRNLNQLSESGQPFSELTLSSDLRKALSPDHLPFHDCGHSDLRSFADEMISSVILRKCCEVQPQFLPNPYSDS